MAATNLAAMLREIIGHKRAGGWRNLTLAR
jgi:hypothetical protein